MVWIRVNDALPEDPRWDTVGAAGFGVYVAALGFCNRNLTDGLLPRSRARRLIECPDVDKVLDALVTAGFLAAVPPDDLQIVDFLECQPSAEKVTTARKAKAERQAKWVERKKAEASRGTSKDASHDGPPVPVPDPGPIGQGGGTRSGAYAPAPYGSPAAAPFPRVNIR